MDGLRIKRGLIGLSAATAAGLLLGRRWVHARSEGAAIISSGDLHGHHDDDWHLKDYLHEASDKTVHAGHTLAHCLRSARRVWEQRQAALAAGGGAAAARPPSAVLLADFLAALHEGPEEARPRRLPFHRASDWLLQRATAPLADPAERQAVCRYLSAVLRSDDAATELLARPGAAPALLQLAAGSSTLQGALGAALARVPAPRAAPAADVAAVVQLLWDAARQLRRQGSPASGQQRRQQRQQLQRMLLALQLLLAWADASADNAAQLAEAGAGLLLADLAALSATGSGVDGLQTLIAQLMGTLARECPKPQQLRMQGWLYHLLCFAADASASGEWQLAGASLASLAACLARGCELPGQLMQRSCLPLLRQLAGLPDAPVRPAIAQVVQALAEGPGVQLPQAERVFWSEALLQWLVAPEPPEPRPASSGSASTRQQQQQAAAAADAAPEERRQLMRQLAAALQALATPAGTHGLHVAHAWLAELIVHLSHQVQPYNEVPTAPPPGAEAAAAAGGWRGWWPWGGSAAAPAGGASGAEAASAAAATAAAAAAAAAAPPEGGSDDLPAPAVALAAEGPYLPPLPPPDAADEAAAASWWRPSAWWPWAGGSGEQGSAGAGAGAGQQIKASGKPSDSELALYINAAAIGPVYARSVAAALLEASGRVGSFQEPPTDAEALMSPDEIAVYPQVAAAIDMDIADSAVCQALKVLCALASGGGRRRGWLLEAGILPLLHRLTMERSRDVAELPSSAGAYVDEAIPLCIQRQAVRLLAMLASDVAGAGAVQDAGWVPWLQDLAASQDLKLSSCASRALLHIESAAASQRPGLAGLALPLRAVPAPLLPAEPPPGPGAAPGSPQRPGLGPGAGGAGGGQGSPAVQAAEAVVAEVEGMLGGARHRMSQVKRRLDRSLDAVRPPVPEAQRLVLQDGVHLFDPLAPHHEVLAREGVGAAGADAPLLDIVFVHGIRGGAFVTWRREGVLERGQARESLDRSVCWPSSWVAREVPEARLLSLEYAAPASGWEGESLPFQHTVAQLMDKLAAAGVGARPVVFVCHSMGGLVIKELLVTAARQKDERLRRIAEAAWGAVFYAVPHAGSRLADWGWYLRYVGGAPAKHVRQLKPGSHLEELNAAVRALCKSGRLPVLSFSEGLPTKLGYIPAQVVPHESAYPGYGEFVVLSQHDHISACKPADPSDPAYARLMAFLRKRVRAAREARAQADALDHMEAAAM